MGQSRAHTIYSLQIGRGFAAIGVTIHHAAAAVYAVHPEMIHAVYKLLRLGAIWIYYFFVLSGFIIAHVTREMRNDKESARRYAWSRFLRIYVPYLPVSLAMVYVLVNNPELSQGARDHIGFWWASLGLLPDANPPAISVAWTLQHEVMFYFLFGVCFFWLKNIRLLYFWVVAMAIGLFLPLGRAEAIPLGMVNINFLFGMLICEMYHRDIFYRSRHLLLAIGIVLMGFMASWALKHPIMSPLLLQMFGGASAFIILGIVYIERSFDFGRFRTLVFLGTASYSIYLIHGPVTSVLMRLAMLSPHWVVSLVAFVVLSCLAGIAYHLWFEKPATAYFKRRLHLSSAG